MESFSLVSEGPSPLKKTKTVKIFFFADDQVPGHHPRALKRLTNLLDPKADSDASSAEDDLEDSRVREESSHSCAR